MKLSDHHSCDSFAEGTPLEVEAVPVARECTQRSLDLMKETSEQVVYFVQILEQRMLVSGIHNLSPLVIHCIYRAAIALAWMAKETNEERYVTGKLICTGMLVKLDARWKVAGSLFVGCSISYSCTNSSSQDPIWNYFELRRRRWNRRFSSSWGFTLLRFTLTENIP
jgi:hypothetical protein